MIKKVNSIISATWIYTADKDNTLLDDHAIVILEDEIFDILEEEKSDDLFGIFHCFTGTLEQAHQAISYNMKLGIGGVATFKNGKIDQFLNEIELKHIVLETDSPYLAPKPFRGKRNESSYLTLVAEKVASCYAVSVDVIAQRTSENALSIFKNQKINFTK